MKKIDLNKEKWQMILIGLECAMQQMGTLPEPLRSRELFPFMELHKELLDWLEHSTEVPKNSS